MEELKQIPPLVHFFGPDGSGKSTQATVLVSSLRRCGINADMCWLRSPHTIAFLLWRLFVRIGFYRAVLNPFGISVRLPAVDKTRSLRTFWALAEFLGVLPLIMRFRFLILRGHTLVAERYVLDTITTIAYFIDDMNFLKSRIARLLLLFIPKGTVFIFLDSDFETIFDRRAPLFGANSGEQGRKGYGSIPRTAVEPRVFIDFQRTAYRILAAHFNALEIDTAKHSVEETHDKILEYLRVR